MNVVDDYGRYDGRASILRATLYPLKLDRVSERDVETWLRNCEETGLVTVYTVEGKQYLELLKFDQRLRAKNSKWPHPPSSAVRCQHVSSNATEVTTESEVKHSASGDALAGFKSFWIAYPRKKSKGQAEKAWRKLRPPDAMQAGILQALERAKRSEDWKKDNGKFIPYPATWLNAKGWEDEDISAAKPKFGGI
jgi:hypothetical protein